MLKNTQPQRKAIKIFFPIPALSDMEKVGFDNTLPVPSIWHLIHTRSTPDGSFTKIIVSLFDSICEEKQIWLIKEQKLLRKRLTK